MSNIMFAFLITLFAGLSTGIGSCIAFFAKKTNTKFLSVSLGFSAGVMIYVSMIEIFPKAQDALTKSMGEKLGSWSTVIAFFAGMAIIAIIDKLIPQEENPHEIKKMENVDEKNIQKNKSLLRTGIFTAMAIAIHNFPEGLATFISALDDATIAIPIAIAIAIHNIPEGISVSVPVYYATGDKKKAFYYSFLSGMSEPLGAIIGYVLLRNFLNDTTLGIVFAIVGGIMVFISLDELLPSAREYGEHHLSIYGLIAGMIVMAISLLLFK
ncbi:zinc transporter ZupT [Clostridioides sp. ZZV14-6154]|nr:zinc transporter ZupT [Clostridioides sp. ZZV14-6150]MCC0659875.1 zinc transporter ZupT [Clostridioides sp. ZZV14-6154]MCC0666610.1 zinc transporter ZupT [Clostridioides sp. ZZV14-6153]MCC0717632.1 zinc transporter ZupT [Clostridioides sp. ZZV14-6105]MCC0722798.1 zinc transporter ZupT [Clostridioides sp. ZZV14-6104]MCC0725328.1 zinc transporter ZupT [Clostridioides sp. ZZV14-6045]MCC0729072.1 zinc transporter ZupT [Clostridioides sp. ZZV14-6048]MCC0734177.1 zinc transporter ZupT [Clostrid